MEMDDDARRRLARVKDPGLRKLLEDMLPYVKPDGPDSRELQKREEEREWAELLTDSALRGVFGSQAKRIAEECTMNDNNRSAEACLLAAKRIQRLPARLRERRSVGGFDGHRR